MSKKANPAVIGAFVVGAVIILVASILTFGSGAFLRDTVPCVMYFDGSVGGLDVGAPVVLRGVKVGAVTDVQLVFDHSDDSFRIPVFADIYRGTARQVGGTPRAREKPVEDLVQRGLRARLASQSFITGKLQVELTFQPGVEPRFGKNDTDLPQIPTMPTTLQTVMKELGDLPLAQIVEDTHRLVKGASEIVNSEDARNVLASLHMALVSFQDLTQSVDGALQPMVRSFQDLTQSIDGTLQPMAQSFQETSETARQSLDMARQALERIESMLDEDSPLRFELSTTLRQLSGAARSIRIAADYFEQHPEALLQGRGKPRGDTP